MSNDITTNINNNTIKSYFDIDYDEHKKNIVNEIFKQIDIIMQIFNDGFNDNVIKMHILYKKKLLNDYECEIIENLNNIIQYIKNIKYIDQEEYLNIILKLVKIYIIIKKVIKRQNNNQNNNNSNNKYKKLIDINIIYMNIIGCVDLLSHNNYLIKVMFNILDYNDESSNNKKQNIILLSEILSTDYFMYWNSSEIYKILCKKIKTESTNKLMHYLKKYKIEFLKNYRIIEINFKELYIDQINFKLIKKFKYNNKFNKFTELCDDLVSVDKEIKH
jgi:hypothetical protein